MRYRKHHNNDGRASVKVGQTRIQVMHIVRRVGLKTIDMPETDYDRFIRKKRGNIAKDTAPRKEWMICLNFTE
ncbi:MAG TPA: hypothetical protein ENH82_02710 [bacterium]|nr:hypothetical protein [bacterium]